MIWSCGEFSFQVYNGKINNKKYESTFKGNYGENVFKLNFIVATLPDFLGIVFIFNYLSVNNHEQKLIREFK